MKPDTELRYVKRNRELMVAIGGSNFPVGSQALLLGEMYHTRGKWKGQFFLYHVLVGNQEYTVTEFDFVLVVQ